MNWMLGNGGNDPEASLTAMALAKELASIEDFGDGLLSITYYSETTV